MEKIKIGKITSPVGLKGEVKIVSFSDDPMRFEMLDHVFVSGKDGSMTDSAIEGIRYKGSGIILKIEGIDDRNASEAARGCELFMDEADLPVLEEGQYYVRDMVGSDIVLEDGTLIGTLKDVLTNTAQDVYVVERRDGPGNVSEGEMGGKKNAKKDLLIPGVPQFILDVDIDEKKIIVRLPEGLMEL